MQKSKATKVAMLLCIGVLVGGIAAMTLPAAGQINDTAAAELTQWEFCSFKVSVTEPTNKTAGPIMKLGREGWELVSVANHTSNGTTSHIAYYFKRRL